MITLESLQRNPENKIYARLHWKGENVEVMPYSISNFKLLIIINKNKKYEKFIGFIK